MLRGLVFGVKLCEKPAKKRQFESMWDKCSTKENRKFSTNSINEKKVFQMKRMSVDLQAGVCGNPILSKHSFSSFIRLPNDTLIR